jgi:very-short-patch-repair endonuclease
MDARLEALQKASLRLPAAAAFSGLTAAWLHGLDTEPCSPIYATAPHDAGISTRAGMVIRRARLDASEVVKRKGLPTTAITRTLLDVSLRHPLTEAVVVTDMALHARLTTLIELTKWTNRSAGTHGVRRLRRTLEHADAGAASPMETRLRMLLVLAGLPRPETQVPIRKGLVVLGRPDLYYRDKKLGLEYDGAIHRNKLEEDNRRQNRLTDAGVRLLRFTAGDIYNEPDQVVALVRGALAA